MAFALYILQQASVGSKTRSGVRTAVFVCDIFQVRWRYLRYMHK